MRNPETTEEFLRRGGTITRCSPGSAELCDAEMLADRLTNSFSPKILASQSTCCKKKEIQ